MRPLLIALALAACNSAAGPPTPPATAPAATVPAPTQTGEVTAASAPPSAASASALPVLTPSASAAPTSAPRSRTPGEQALITTLCTKSPCAGPMARLELWRDERGGLGRVVYDGDIQRCSHPPRRYLDRNGKETLVIPLEPVMPGSAKALQYERTQADQLAGLTRDATITCGE